MWFLSGEEFFQEGERIAVTHSSYHPRIEKHKHDFYEIVYVTKGSGYHIINDKKHQISAGSMLLITKGSVHSYCSDGEMEWINILFHPQIVDNSLINSENAGNVLSSVLFSDILKININEMTDIEVNLYGSNIEPIVWEMYEEYKNKRSGYQEILSGYLQVLMIKLFRAYSQSPDREMTNQKSMSITQIVIDYMNEYSMHDISLDTIAKKAFMSPRYFQMLFKKTTGESFITFIRKYKIQKACDLLRETDLTVEEVMQQVDMKDPKNFYNTFKKYVGVTPKKYRDESTS
jgi:AraC-like DNA-binding protein